MKLSEEEAVNLLQTTRIPVRFTCMVQVTVSRGANRETKLIQSQLEENNGLVLEPGVLISDDKGEVQVAVTKLIHVNNSSS